MERSSIKEGLQNEPSTYYGAVDTMADNKGISLDEHDISQIIIKDDPVRTSADFIGTPDSDESCRTKCVTYTRHNKYKLYVCVMMMLTYFIMQCDK